MLVSQAMNRSVVTVTRDAPLADAVALVRRTGAEHVLVVEDEHLVGVLCACDLRGARAGTAVGDRMKAAVMTVRPDAAVEEAAATMTASGVGCLPVTLGGLILGTVSEAEIARAGVHDAHPRCEKAHRRAKRVRH